ncbi:MAG: nuclear transport factor 2 family protein [Chloroflexota bacterium]
MDRHESTRVVERFWAAMAASDFRGAGDLLHDDYVLDWPQSGERIRGRSNFVAINEAYPAAGRWRIELHRLVADGDAVATDVTVTDGVRHDRVITFSEVRDGRIVRQVEYWPDPFDPAPWREQWVQRA